MEVILLISLFNIRFFPCYLHLDIDLRNQWCSASEITLPLISSSSSTTFFSYFASSSLLSTRYFLLTNIFRYFFFFKMREICSYCLLCLFLVFLLPFYLKQINKQSITSLFISFSLNLSIISTSQLTLPIFICHVLITTFIYSLFKILTTPWLQSFWHCCHSFLKLFSSASVKLLPLSSFSGHSSISLLFLPSASYLFTFPFLLT